MKTFISILFFILFIIDIVLFSQDSISERTAIVIACVTLCLSVFNIIFIYEGKFSLSSAFISYTVLTQFGLFLPYYLYGDSVVDQFQPWTLAFLSSRYLFHSVILGSIAVSSFELFRFFSYKKFKNTYSTDDSLVALKSKGQFYFSIFLLSLMLLFFIYHIATGGMELVSTYEQYMESSAYLSPIYHSMLIVFYVGTLYLACSGPIISNKYGWLLWLFIVLIFALNGNKGEFLYSLLAVFGVKGIQGTKISSRVIFLITFLLFFFIPTISSLRSVGITQNLSSASFNPFGAFVEMGMQIRTTVYSMECLETGEIQQLFGQSYWQPIVNILTPFMKHTIATMKIREMFPGYGYNQVIESYVNFKVFGTVAFYSIIGYYLTKYENLVRKSAKLAYLGSITTVLINASRNYFAFVPGHIIMVTVFYVLARKLFKS